MINSIGYAQEVKTNLYQRTSVTAEMITTDSQEMDTVEISADAYKLAEVDPKMTATSGKDILGITKGDKDNSFIVHFADSAMINRAVSRGYITVNGIELKLSEETKQKLLMTDKQAEAERIKAYNEYVHQHEMAVAKQQSEALRNAFKKTSDEVRNLLEIIIQGQPEKQKMQYDKALKAYGSSNDGVSWSQFEWRTYDTQMAVAVDDTVIIEDISIGETIINEGRK